MFIDSFPYIDYSVASSQQFALPVI